MVFTTRKRLFLLFFGITFLGHPYLGANISAPISSSAGQKPKASTLSSLSNLAFYFVPAAFSAYSEAQHLSSSYQKSIIGNKQANAQTKEAIEKIAKKMGIESKLDIIAMQDGDYQVVFKEQNPHDSLIQEYKRIESHQKNFIGVHATNRCIFIDENIINFEQRPLMATFLVTHALEQYKNNYFSKVIIGNVTLTMAQAVALYKTFPLISQAMNDSISKLGWTSFNDPQAQGIFLGFSRFTLNYLVCPLITQTIIESIKNKALAWYHKTIQIPLKASLVPRGYTLNLLGELIQIMPYYEIDQETNQPFAHETHGKKLLTALIHEVCLIAQNRYHNTIIIKELEAFMLDTNFAECRAHLETVKNFFEYSNRTIAL